MHNLVLIVQRYSFFCTFQKKTGRNFFPPAVFRFFKQAQLKLLIITSQVQVEIRCRHNYSLLQTDHHYGWKPDSI